MSDIVQRLRRKTVAGQPVFPTPLDIEAADEIERLRQRVAELERVTAIRIPTDVMEQEIQSHVRRAIEPLKTRLADAKQIIEDYCESSDCAEGEEYGLHLCCRTRDYKPHADDCVAWNWLQEARHD